MRGFGITALVLAIAGTSGAPVFACINEIGAVRIQDILQKGDPREVAEVIVPLANAYARKPTLENTNDFGIAQLLTGKVDQAIELFREAEEKFPGNARVAANLGTALELKGENAEAVRWIREGVRRDPGEHRGTEWLHVKILEAKLAMAGNADWLETHSVLGLDFGAAPRPHLPQIVLLKADGKTRTPEGLYFSIYYQLGERTKFIKPNDAIVADLYETAGNLSYSYALANRATGDRFGDPAQAFADAQWYGSRNPQRVLLRSEQFAQDYPNRSWFQAVTTVTKP